MAALLASVLTVVVVGVVLAATRYLPALDDARDLRLNLVNMVDRATVAGMDLDRTTLVEMQSDLAAASERFAALQTLLSDDPLVALARAMPPTHDTVAGTDSVASAGQDLLEAADAAIVVAGRYVAIREEQSTAAVGSQGEASALARFVELMATGRGDMDRAVAAIDRAGATLEAAPSDLPGPIADVRELMQSRIHQYGPALRSYAELDDSLPGMLGWDAPKRYLILTQNPAELKPTGGLIGSFGTITFDRGKVTERMFQDVALLDLPWDYPFIEPPTALARYLLGPKQPWQLADANWSADFPTSAQAALRLYTNEGGKGPIDGVVGITTHTIDEFLEITGPVNVPDYDVTIAAGETTLKTMQHTRVARDPATNRKAFLSSFADRLFDAVFALPPDRWPDLLAKGDELRAARLMLVWSSDPTAQSAIAALGLDGAIRSDQGDYLYPVDTNVSPVSKLNGVTDRELDVDVHLDEVGNAVDTLAVRWTNHIESPEARPYRELARLEDLRTLGMYFRLYVPERSRIEAVSAGTEAPITAPAAVNDEGGRMVIANYFRIPSGTADLMYRWLSPYAADLGEDGIATYRLTIQKQPGLRPGPLRLRITVPKGALIVDASLGLLVSGETATVETTFDRDVVVVIRYRPAPEAA